MNTSSGNLKLALTGKQTCTFTSFASFSRRSVSAASNSSCLQFCRSCRSAFNPVIAQFRKPLPSRIPNKKPQTTPLADRRGTSNPQQNWRPCHNHECATLFNRKRLNSLIQSVLMQPWTRRPYQISCKSQGKVRTCTWRIEHIVEHDPNNKV